MLRPRWRLIGRFYVLGLVQLALVILAALILPPLVLGPPEPPDLPPLMRDRPPPHWDFDRPPHGPHPPFMHPPSRLPGFNMSHVGARKRLLFYTLALGLVVVGLGAWWTRRMVMGPLSDLTRATQDLGAGDLSVRIRSLRQDEFGDVSRAFDEMAQQLQKLVLSEKELMANISHELRTPLARIRVALDLAAEGNSDTARASLALILTDLAELEVLIDDVMMVRRLELIGGKTATSGWNIERRAERPEVLANESFVHFQACYPNRHLELKLHQEDLPDVMVDPRLFRRVLDNLLDNAHKYSSDPESKVVLEVLKEESNVVFQISDQGQGLDPKDLQYLGDPFFRAERSRSRSGGGVGLGLTLVKRIVEAHGGTLTFAHASKQGTVVRVTL